MIFITGPLWSGKRAAAMALLGCDEAELAHRAVWDVQDLANESIDLEQLAKELSRHEVVIATEVGGGVVPVDRAEREARERAGRLSCLLAERADTVMRVFCGIPRIIKGGYAMRICLLRHGRTEYNEQRRYLGKRDIPLSEGGAAELHAADFTTDLVFVSPKLRARQTARILFPDARQEIVEGLEEMDFGDFEGRSAAEMAEDPAYRAWVDGGCTERCPNGETRAEFCARTCAAMTALVERAAAEGRETLAVVAHGGTLRAVLEQMALPSCASFDVVMPNGGGYLLEYDEELWKRERRLRRIGMLRYAGDGGAC